MFMFTPAANGSLGSVRVCVHVCEWKSADFISSEDVASCLETGESCLDVQIINGGGVRDAATRAEVSCRIHMQNIRSAQRSQRDEPVNKGTNESLSVAERR